MQSRRRASPGTGSAATICSAVFGNRSGYEIIKRRIPAGGQKAGEPATCAGFIRGVSARGGRC